MQKLLEEFSRKRWQNKKVNIDKAGSCNSFVYNNELDKKGAKTARMPKISDDINRQKAHDDDRAKQLKHQALSRTHDSTNQNCVKN
ncbi:hypothetical protein FACS189449_13160 [Alphaproteobacteria bacterium]|nr:hypothetical protein FACS189449_13160 [Alphaproteobacteria bacterium]